MLNFSGLSMVMGNKLLLHEIDLLISRPGRYGVVGANGSGKSTLFKLITNELQPSEGSIQISRDLKLGWLNQDHFKFDDEIIVNVVLRGNKKLWDALQAKEKLLQVETFDEDAVNKLAHLEEIIQHEDGYTAESVAQNLLTGLGIAEKHHYDTLSTLSGGYKIRVLLAQALFNNPDILLLDEPTNHLDIVTTQWLEIYLQKAYRGILLFISHDRDFLNNLSNYILDVDYGDLRLYHGNYDAFCQQKNAIVEQKEQALQSNIKKIEHMQKFVDKFRAKASKAKQAQSRMKMIEKIELPEKEVSSRAAPRVNFTMQRPSGKHVLTVNDLCKSYGEKVLYKNLRFSINRGEKVAIIGHNGIGKSTLVKQLLGKVQDAEQDFTWGHETHIAYFSQDHHEQLKDNISIYNWLRNQPLKLTDSDIRKALGMMLFSKKDVEKSILSLSGGEAARVLLAKIMLENPNVLVFDEPTNHLDLEAIDALTKALCAFAGTLIMVSHNRYFVGKIAKRVLAMTDNGVKDYLGSYQEFIDYHGEDYLSSLWLKKYKSA